MDPATADVHTFDQQRQVRQRRQVKNTHHSTPLAGGAVAGAGLMTMKHGQVREVTDESGHYRPDAAYTHQAVGKMAEQKLLDRPAKPKQRRKAGPGTVGATVTLAGYAENDPRQAKGWLKDEKDIFKGPLSLPYQAFLQGAGNERQMRAKALNLGDVKMEAGVRKRRQMKRAKDAWREGGEVGPKPTWSTGKKRGEAASWGPTEITPEESRQRAADRKADHDAATSGNDQDDAMYDLDPAGFEPEEKDTGGTGGGGGTAPLFYTLDHAEEEGKESEEDGGLDLDGVMYTLDESELEEEEEEKSGYRYSVGKRR